MKRKPTLFIQIPFWNEEETLGRTLDDLPRTLPGVGRVCVLGIDDGSTDRSVEVARSHGIDFIVILPGHRGLAQAFSAGIEACLLHGADIIVNTDADNQYRGANIAGLIEPILKGQAEMVLGARQFGSNGKYPRLKLLLQRVGSWVVRLASGAEISDASSGFRAFTRDLARKLNVSDRHTYTLDTLIQAGRKRVPIAEIPIEINPTPRPSRLIRSQFQYVTRSALTILRLAVLYAPLRFLGIPGACLFLTGAVLDLRFLYYHFTLPQAGHVQSLVIGTLFTALGVGLGIAALLADMIAANRKLMEEIVWRQKTFNETLARADQAGGTVIALTTENQGRGKRNTSSRKS